MRWKHYNTNRTDGRHWHWSGGHFWASIQILKCVGHWQQFMGLLASRCRPTQKHSKMLWQIVHKTMHCRHLLRLIPWTTWILRKSNVCKVFITHQPNNTNRILMLHFFRCRPQGIAYKNIPIDKSTPIYPMACSTSARSSIRLINASSFVECLQFRCMKIITKYPQMINVRR